MKHCSLRPEKLIALVDAVTENNIRAVAKMIRIKGINVNETLGHLAFTPLHFAAQYNAAECADLLLSVGAKIESVTADNKTSLEIAAEYGHIEVLEVLMSYIMMIFQDRYQSVVKLSGGKTQLPYLRAN